MIASAYCGGLDIITYSAINICRSAFPISSVCSKYPDISSCEQNHSNVTSEIRYITLHGIVDGYNGTEYQEQEDETYMYLSPFAYFLQTLLKLQE